MESLECARETMLSARRRSTVDISEIMVVSMNSRSAEETKPQFVTMRAADDSTNYSTNYDHRRLNAEYRKGEGLRV